jgi:hypothetical protein
MTSQLVEVSLKVLHHSVGRNELLTLLSAETGALVAMTDEGSLSDEVVSRETDAEFLLD